MSSSWGKCSEEYQAIFLHVQMALFVLTKNMSFEKALQSLALSLVISNCPSNWAGFMIVVTNGFSVVVC